MNGQTVTYCRNRVRDQLSDAIWGLLMLFFGVCLCVYGFSMLGEDKSGWDTMEYVKLGIGWLAGIGLTAAGAAGCYLAVRGVLRPEKSAVANSIRSQLPRPEEAPGWQELFAMVDRDLAANGRWFGKVGIGSQWMLGDEVSFLPRIRGVFRQDEIRHRASSGRSSRVTRLLIIDDRKQSQITAFQDPRDLDAVVQCLRLRVPAAYFGSYNDYIGYCDRPDDEWDRMEREFRQRQAQLEQRARETAIPAQTGPGWVLTDYPSQRRTSQVDREGLARRLEGLERGQQFKLEPTGSIPAGMKRISDAVTEELAAVNCVLDQGGTFWLTVRLRTRGNGAGELPRGFAMVNPAKEEMLELLAALVERGEVPDVFGPGWKAVQLRESRPAPQQDQRSAPYLNITDGAGVSRKYHRFSRRDVELAAEKVAEGSYRSAILWLPPRLVFLDAGTKEDARTTLQIGLPQDGGFRTRMIKTTGRQAAEWFVDCLEGKLPDGYQGWKDVTRDWEKRVAKMEKQKAKEEQ